MQTPELLLTSLNKALRRLRGACTVLDNEEVDEKLLEVMRRLLLAEILGNTWIVAMGGSQGAGKTTLMACMYDLRTDGPRWLQGNEGRGEKMPVLILEEDGVQQPQGYVRRLTPDEANSGFKLEDAKVDVAQFQRAVCDPNAEDLLPVLRVPRRYFKRNNQAWMVLPGYEKQDRANRAWQELMRQAMIAAGGCIVVTDETRMANQQQLEIVKDILENELKDCKPYIVISKTEAYRHDPKRREELVASAQATFQVNNEVADNHIILSGADDPEYMEEWMPMLRSAINDLNFTGHSGRHLQMSHLSEIVGKDLSRVLNTIRSKSRLYFTSDSGGLGDGAEVLKEVLDKFDDAAEALRDKHTAEVDAIADQAFSTAAEAMGNVLKEDHEGFINWISNAMDSTSETAGRMRTLVQRSWHRAVPKFYSDYSDSLATLTSAQLGRQSEDDSQAAPQTHLPLARSRKLIQLGYVHPSGQPVRYTKLNPEKVSDIRILLGNSSQEEEQAYQDTSKQLGISVALLPALTLEYSRIAYAMPESWGLTQDYDLAHKPSGNNVAVEGVESIKTGVELGRTAIKSFAALMAVDVVSDGDSDILSVFTASKPDGSPSLPVGTPLTLHPAAVAVTAVVATVYVASMAVTRMRTFEREASAQAHSMLANVRDQHVNHLRSQFDHAMKVARDRVKEKMRARYRMDETLMRKDRLATAIADVTSIASDLRHELDSSATGLQPLLASGGA